MRLSHGFVRGEALSCIYHGWSYAQAGNCLRIPAHPGLSPPETIRVATQRVEEADGLLWVAVGDPAHQPPALAGLVPLRSLTAEADIGAIERAAGATLDARGVLETVENSQAVRLLLVELQPHRTLVHVLVDDGATPAERIMASRAAESLRRRAESLQGGIA